MNNPVEPRSAPLRPFLATRIAAATCLLLLSLNAFPQSSESILPGPKPADAPLEWKKLVGIYLDENSKHSYVLLEKGQQLLWLDEKGISRKFSVLGDVAFPPSEGQSVIGHSISRDAAGNATGFCYLNFCYRRTDAGGDPSHSYHVTPTRPISDLRRAVNWFPWYGRTRPGNSSLESGRR